MGLCLMHEGATNTDQIKSAFLSLALCFRCLNMLRLKASSAAAGVIWRARSIAQVLGLSAVTFLPGLALGQSGDQRSVSASNTVHTSNKLPKCKHHIAWVFF